MGPLGAATVVVGCEKVAVVLAVSEFESPHPAMATARAQRNPAGNHLIPLGLPQIRDCILSLAVPVVIRNQPVADPPDLGL
jgi:hypothetical protein